MIGKLVILSLASSVLLQAVPNPPPPLTQGIAAFRKAYQTWDGEGLVAAATHFKHAAKAHPKSASCHYWLGTARFHRMLQLQGHHTLPQHNESVATQMELTIDALKTTISLDPTQAEAHAMLATIYGMKIHGSFLRAIRYGHTVQKHYKQALAHGDKNPRVQYLLGTGLLHTAKDDSDRLEALKTLLLAEALFDAEPSHKRPNTAPRWGKDACLAFMGQTFTALHKPDKAKDYFRKALRARPSNMMAKAGLASLNR